MSATRMLRKLLTRSGSGGVSRVTAGLSSVGPPPTLMMIQLFASATYVSPPGPEKTSGAAEYVGVEAHRALDVLGDDEVGQQNSCCRRCDFGHRTPPLIGVSHPLANGSSDRCY